jgi:hypothetical protein
MIRRRQPTRRKDGREFGAGEISLKDMRPRGARVMHNEI